MSANSLNNDNDIDPYDFSMGSIHCQGKISKTERSNYLLVNWNQGYNEKDLEGLFQAGFSKDLVKFFSNDNQISIKLLEKGEYPKQLLWVTTITFGVLALYFKREFSGDIFKQKTEMFLKELANELDIELTKSSFSKKESQQKNNRSSLLSVITEEFLNYCVSAEKLEKINFIINETLLQDTQYVQIMSADNFQDILSKIATSLSIVIYFLGKSQTDQIYPCGTPPKDYRYDEYSVKNPRVHLSFMVIIEKQENRDFEVFLSDFSKVYQETPYYAYKNSIKQTPSNKQGEEILEIQDPLFGEILFSSMQNMVIAIKQGDKGALRLLKVEPFKQFFEEWKQEKSKNNSEKNQQSKDDIQFDCNFLKNIFLSIKKESNPGKDFINYLAKDTEKRLRKGDCLMRDNNNYVKIQDIQDADFLTKELKYRKYKIYFQPKLNNLLSQKNKSDKNNKKNTQSNSSSSLLSLLCCIVPNNSSNQPDSPKQMYEEFIIPKDINNQGIHYSSFQSDQYEEKKKPITSFQYLLKNEIYQIIQQILSQFSKFEKLKYCTQQKTILKKQESLQKYVKPKSQTQNLSCGPPRICHQCGGIATSSFKDIAPICRQCLRNEWEDLC